MQENKSFYVVDFFRNFFKLHNIPIMIYLLLNLVFIYVGSLLLTQIHAELFAADRPLPLSFNSTEYYLVTALVIAAVYCIALVISLSPVGEWLLRRKEKFGRVEEVRYLTDYDRERISRIFDAVYQNARQADPSVSDKVQLFVKMDSDPNAFAMGRRTVCVTTGLLSLPDELIQGVLGHEFGHLVHKDTDIGLVINIANWLTNIVFLGVWGLLYLYKLLMKTGSIILAIFGKGAVRLAGVITNWVFTAVAFLTIRLFQKVWLIIGNLLYLATSRGAEYQADLFSCSLGYTNGLTAFFQLLPDAVPGKRTPFRRMVSALASIGSTHPATWRRLENIQQHTASLSQSN